MTHRRQMTVLACALSVLLACADARRPLGSCGNGVVDPDELCDGDAFGGLDCRDFDAYRGALRCSPDCRAIDTGGCEAAKPGAPVADHCGNGIVGEGEDCDTLPPELDCATLGEGEGPVSCDVNCRYDLSRCCRPTSETCNGEDDDCDGRADEATCGEGTGCIEGRCQGCQPAPERCNGSDDDCDGVSDEGFDLGQPCTASAGSCVSNGVIACIEEQARCSALPPVAVDESCNGRDDDCDGDADEGDDLCDGDAVCVAGDCALRACAPAAAAELRGEGRSTGETGGGSTVSGSCGGEGPELTYIVRRAARTRVCVDTAGSAIDTVLHVRADCEVADSEVGCNDDADGLTSRLEWVAEPGVAYSVFVDSYQHGGEVAINVTDGACPTPCAPVDMCQLASPDYVLPAPDQIVDHDAGRVMRLFSSAPDDCDRIELRASKLDGSDMAPGTYHLRVGTCRPEGVIRETQRLDAPARAVVFETTFGGAPGAIKEFCVTKAAATVSEPDHAAWWYSNLARLTRVARQCP